MSFVYVVPCWNNPDVVPKITIILILIKILDIIIEWLRKKQPNYIKMYSSSFFQKKSTLPSAMSCNKVQNLSLANVWRPKYLHYRHVCHSKSFPTPSFAVATNNMSKHWQIVKSSPQTVSLLIEQLDCAHKNIHSNFRCENSREAIIMNMSN